MKGWKWWDVNKADSIYKHRLHSGNICLFGMLIRQKMGQKFQRLTEETTEKALCSLAGCFNQFVFLLCLHICVEKHPFMAVLLQHLETHISNKVSIVLNSALSLKLLITVVPGSTLLHVKILSLSYSTLSSRYHAQISTAEMQGAMHKCFANVLNVNGINSEIIPQIIKFWKDLHHYCLYTSKCIKHKTTERHLLKTYFKVSMYSYTLLMNIPKAE